MTEESNAFHSPTTPAPSKVFGAAFKSTRGTKDATKAAPRFMHHIQNRTVFTIALDDGSAWRFDFLDAGLFWSVGDQIQVTKRNDVAVMINMTRARTAVLRLAYLAPRD